MGEPTQSGEKPKFNPDLRKRYGSVRPLVKETTEEMLQEDPTLDRQTVQSTSFRTAEKMYPHIYRDSLTDLYNVRWFSEELARKVARANRRSGSNSTNLQFTSDDFNHQRKTYIILFDIDHLKKINDGLGHDVGNDALRLIKKLHTREDEPIARDGGDEFAQLVEIPENVTEEEAEHILQIIVARHTTEIASESKTLLSEGPEKIQKSLSFSYGIARILPGDTAETVKKRADLALYKAKEQRNKAVIANTAFVTDREDQLYFKDVYNGNTHTNAIAA